MKKRKKKAAWIAAFGYCSIVGFGLGMLKAAQQTRRTLYGGTPVLAQVTHQTLPETESAASEIILGGGEWKLSLSLPEADSILQKAEYLPPSMAKLLLRMAVLSDQAADQTAAFITGA